MKDLDVLAAKKEYELGRVQKEVEALRTVISMLEETGQISNEKFQLFLPSHLELPDDPGDEMSHLEIYYGFVKHLNSPR